mmetsp:Transcript_23679/g.42242  ORF Transcript_23679/g.42242 Transcript_23679/m.42242 type:complete len:237 (-) Transcript_23679:5371-6081(-)
MPHRGSSGPLRLAGAVPNRPPLPTGPDQSRARGSDVRHPDANIVSLYGPQGQTGDEVLLHRKEHQDRGYGRHQRRGRDKVPVVHELTIQGAHTSGDGLGTLPLGQHVGPEKVIPDKGKDQHRQRRNRRAHKGQHHVPENLPLRDPLDPRGFHQIKGQGLDKVAHKEGTKARLERRMKQELTRDCVIKARLHRHVPHRHHEDLEGDEVARHKEEKQRQSDPETVDGKGVTRQAGQRD